MQLKFLLYTDMHKCFFVKKTIILILKANCSISPPFHIVFNLPTPHFIHPFSPRTPLFLLICFSLSFFPIRNIVSIHLVYNSLPACLCVCVRVCVLFLWAYCTYERMMMMVVVGLGSFRLAGDFFLSTASASRVEWEAATGKGDCYLCVCFWSYCKED